MVKSKVYKRSLPLQTRYLMITVKGVQFVEKWYQAESIPADLAKLYQLTLKLTWMRGVMPFNLATRIYYGKKPIELAKSRGYVKITRRYNRLSEDVKMRIREIIGEAPRQIYA